jgi:hypothetical protein
MRGIWWWHGLPARVGAGFHGQAPPISPHEPTRIEILTAHGLAPGLLPLTAIHENKDERRGRTRIDRMSEVTGGVPRLVSRPR